MNSIVSRFTHLNTDTGRIVYSSDLDPHNIDSDLRQRACTDDVLLISHLKKQKQDNKCVWSARHNMAIRPIISLVLDS